MREQSLNSWLHWGNHWVFTFFTNCSKDINKITFDARGVFSAFLDVKAEAKFVNEPKSQTAIAKLFLREYAATRAIVVVEQKLFKQYNALRISITALFEKSEEPPLNNLQMSSLPTAILNVVKYRSDSTIIDEMTNSTTE